MVKDLVTYEASLGLFAILSILVTRINFCLCFDQRNENYSHHEKLTETTEYQVTRVSGKPLGPVRCSVCNSSPTMNGSECIYNPRRFEMDCIAPVTSQFGPYTGCRKIEQWIDLEINAPEDPVSPPNYRVIRQCAYFANNDNRQCVHSGSIGAQQLVCYCQGTGCNREVSVKNSILITLTAMTSVLLHAQTFCRRICL